MNTLGEYQNNITQLKQLDLEHYERIFKIYTTGNSDKEFYFYNILKKITLPENIDSNFLDFYTVSSPLPLTTISHNIYDDIRLWWLIFIINSSVIGKDIFVVPGGTQLKFIKSQYLSIVFNQITKLAVYNGRHY
jgi:hypothetical protein